MRVDFIVIVEPFRQQAQDGFGVWQDDVSGVITLQGFDEGLGDDIALRRADRGEGQPQAQRRCGSRRFPSDVGATVVGQPFDRMRRLGVAEALLDGLYHQIAHHLA